MRYLVIIFEAAVALALVIIINSTVHYAVDEFVLSKSQINPNIIMKVQEKDAKENSESGLTFVSDSMADIVVYAPRKSVFNLSVNGISQGERFLGNMPSFHGYVHLRRGINTITATLIDNGQRRSFWRDSTELFVVYRPSRREDPVLLAIKRNPENVLIAYGLAEPYSTIDYCFQDQSKFIRDFVQTDVLGVFSFRFWGKDDFPDVVYLASSTDEVFRRHKWEIKTAIEEHDTLPSSQYRKFFIENDQVKDSNDSNFFKELTRELTLTVDQEILIRDDVNVIENYIRVDANVIMPKCFPLEILVKPEPISPREFVSYFFGLSFTRLPLSGLDEGQVVVVQEEERVRLETHFKISGTFFELSSESLNILPFLLQSGDKLSVVVGSHPLHLNTPPTRKSHGPLAYHWEGPLAKAGTFCLKSPYERDQLQSPSSEAERARVDVESTQKSPIQAINRMREALPLSVQRNGMWLIAAIPYIWLLIILRRDEQQHLNTAVKPPLFTAIIALLLLHSAYILVWFLDTNVYSWIASLFPSSYAEPSDSTNLSTWILGSLGAFPALLLGAVVAFSRIARLFREQGSKPRWWQNSRWLAYRCLIMWPLAVLVFAVLFLPLLFKLQFMTIYETYLRIVDWSKLAIVLILAASLAWLPLFWFLRLLCRRPIPFLVVLLAAWAMLFIPILPKLLEPVISQLRLLLLKINRSPFLIPSDIYTLIWTFLITITGAWVLWRLMRLVMGLDEQTLSTPLTRRSHRWAILAFFVLTAVPLGGFLNEKVNIWTLVSFFHSLVLLLPYVLLVTVYVLLRKSKPDDDFALFDVEIAIGTMVFAFFLSGGKTNILLIPVPLLLGAYLFRRYLLCTSVCAPDVASRMHRIDGKKLLSKLIAFKEAQRLLQSYRKHATKNYVAGELSRTDYEEGLKTATDRKAQAKTQLEMDESTTRLIVFTKGPGKGPLDNAKIAVKYSLPLVLLFQLGTLDSVFSGDTVSYPILEVITSIIQSTGYWLLMAFLFGYFYHVIRGRNGPEKALAFSICLVLPALVIVVLNEQQIFGLYAGERILRILMFVYFLALIAFDGNVLRRSGYHTRELVTVYGAAPMLSYTSSIVALGILPVGQLLRLAFPWVQQLFGMGQG